MIKKVCNIKPEGTREVGRPSLRWEECVWQDIRILGIRNWRSAALDDVEKRKFLTIPELEL
jgi:hypothetical protein